MGLRAKDDGKSESPIVITGIRVATLPYAKASRLPSGLESRESMANHFKGQRR